MTDFHQQNTPSLAPHQVAMLSGVAATTPPANQDRPHPSTHPLWEHGLLLAAMSAPGQLPTPETVAAAISQIEDTYNQTHDMNARMAKAEVEIWAMASKRFLLQSLHSIDEPVLSEKWLAMAAKAEVTLERVSKRARELKVIANNYARTSPNLAYLPPVNGYKR